jgi:hypothetical protein
MAKEYCRPKGKSYLDSRKRYRERKREEKRLAELEQIKKWLRYERITK